MEEFGTLAAVPRLPDLEFADSEICTASETDASAAVKLSDATSPDAAMLPVEVRAIATVPPSAGEFSAI